MARLELTFSIEGEKQLLRRLNDVNKDFKNWRPEFEKTGRFLVRTFERNFDTQGKELGEPWKPLSSATLKQKKRAGYPATSLVRSGSLRKGFRSRGTNSEVVIGNVVSYFQYHQSNKPRRKIPRRIMMKLDEKRKQSIVKIFQKSVESILQRRAFNLK